MNNKHLLTTLLAGTALLSVAGTAHADKLRIAYAVAPITVDSYRSSTAPSGSLNSHIYEGLYSRDNKNLLGTKFTWVTPTRMVVDLRKGVKFHHGTDFTSRDVVYSVCRMMMPVNGKKNVITNSLGPVTNVTTDGPHKVIFDTVKPYPLLIQKLKYLYVMPADMGKNVPQNIKFDTKGECGIGLEGYPKTVDIEAGKGAIGTGPYKLVSFKKNGTTKMVRNENYWGEKPDWKEVEITAVTNNGARFAGLLSGDYDAIVAPSIEDIETLKNNPKFDYLSTPSWRTMFILLNMGEKAPGVTAPNGKNPFQDVRVRKALSLAIDRKAITERLLGGAGTVANQFAANYMDGADTGLPPLEYNPEKAKQMLAEAGYKNGFSVDLFLPADRYPNVGRLSQVIAQYWSRVGLTVNLKPQPWSVFSKTRKAEKLGAWVYGWGHPQGFTQMIIYNFPTKNKDLNLGTHNHYTNYKSAEVDKWMTKWAVETDDNKANEYGRNAMKAIMSDMAGIPIYYQHHAWAFRSDLNIKGRPDGFTKAEMFSKK